MRIIYAIFISVLALASPPAFASDFGVGLLIAAATVFMAMLWPLILPLFYLRGPGSKLRLYFALALTAYGAIGLLSAPFGLLDFIRSFDLFGSSFDSMKIRLLGSVYLVQPMAFVLSLFVSPKVKRLLATP